MYESALHSTGCLAMHGSKGHVGTPKKAVPDQMKLKREPKKEKKGRGGTSYLALKS